MRALFGCGLHPLAELWQQLEGPDLTYGTFRMRRGWGRRSRVLFKANVAASEAYNTSLEQHLRDTLGLRLTASIPKTRD
jgi:hypothetical protein